MRVWAGTVIINVWTHSPSDVVEFSMVICIRENYKAGELYQLFELFLNFVYLISFLKYSMAVTCSMFSLLNI